MLKKRLLRRFGAMYKDKLDNLSIYLLCCNHYYLDFIVIGMPGRVLCIAIGRAPRLSSNLKGQSDRHFQFKYLNSNLHLPFPLTLFY